MSEESVRSMQGSTYGSGGGFHVICDASKDGCGTLSGYRLTEHEAYREWNKRSNV